MKEIYLTQCISSQLESKPDNDSVEGAILSCPFRGVVISNERTQVVCLHPRTQKPQASSGEEEGFEKFCIPLDMVKWLEGRPSGLEFLEELRYILYAGRVPLYKIW